MTDDCYACRMTAQGAALPPREAVIVENGWRLAHAFNSSLEGWLVVQPTRHVRSLDELTAAEAETLGALLRRVSMALAEVLGCSKTYVMSFAEAEGFSHLHVHMVPRMNWFTVDQVGTKVFAFLGGPEAGWVAEQRRDDLAVELRAALKT